MERDCGNCKYRLLEPCRMPCYGCCLYDSWEPAAKSQSPQIEAFDIPDYGCPDTEILMKINELFLYYFIRNSKPILKQFFLLIYLLTLNLIFHLIR